MKIRFLWNEASLTQIRSELRQELDEIYNNFEPKKVVVSSYADESRSETYSQKISLRRAEIIKDQLIADGLASEIIEVRGMGSPQPANPSSTSRGNALNNRIEIHMKVQPTIKKLFYTIYEFLFINDSTHLSTPPCRSSQPA